MTTLTPEAIAFYAAEFERETGCKWEEYRGGLADMHHSLWVGGEHLVHAMEGKLRRRWNVATGAIIADYSAEPIDIAEWHRRAVEYREKQTKEVKHGSN